MRDAYKEVEQLNPKPGASFTNTRRWQCIHICRFLLEAEDEDLNVILNNSRIQTLKK